MFIVKQNEKNIFLKTVIIYFSFYLYKFKTNYFSMISLFKLSKISSQDGKHFSFVFLFFYISNKERNTYRHNRFHFYNNLRLKLNQNISHIY